MPARPRGRHRAHETGQSRPKRGYATRWNSRGRRCPLAACCHSAVTRGHPRPRQPFPVPDRGIRISLAAALLPAKRRSKRRRHRAVTTYTAHLTGTGGIVGRRGVLDRDAKPVPNLRASRVTSPGTLGSSAPIVVRPPGAAAYAHRSRRPPVSPDSLAPASWLRRAPQGPSVRRGGGRGWAGGLNATPVVTANPF
jgi:hypothetical protein